MYTKDEIIANREKWIEALESGMYTQAKFNLRRREGFCCLGVACEVLGIPSEKTDYGYYYYGEERNGADLPKEAMEMLGVRTPMGSFDFDENIPHSSLYGLNDSASWSFGQIAQFLRNPPPGLFIDLDKVPSNPLDDDTFTD